MERHLIEHRYFDTYYFANVVVTVVDEPFDYLRNLEDFYGDGRYLGMVMPFQRYSALHGFIEFALESLFDEQVRGEQLDIRQDQYDQFKSIPSAISDYKPEVLFIERALVHYSMSHESFIDWLAHKGLTFLDASEDDLDEYYSMLREEGPYEELITRIVGEVFFLLFQNRRTLSAFNQMLARQVSRADELEEGHESAKYFAKPGVLKRTDVPAWAKRAVFFRDRGMCTSCGMDLSGILNIGNTENYDHIIPLAQGGLNDVTNLQLLCAGCNSAKRQLSVPPSDFYEAWYPMHA